jgi:hypothetical protein
MFGEEGVCVSHGEFDVIVLSRGEFDVFNHSLSVNTRSGRKF